MHLLPTNLAPLANVAAKEATKFSMTGVHIELRDDNSYTAVATDSKRMIIVDGTCADHKDFPEIPGLDSAPNGHNKAIIPTEAWSKTFKSAEKMTGKRRYVKPILNNVAIVVGEKCATFGMTNLEQAETPFTRQLEGRFPPYLEIIPKKAPTIRMRVCPKLLADTLKAVMALAGDSDEGVTVEFYDSIPESEELDLSEEPEQIPTAEPLTICRPFSITAQNREKGQTIHALQMPFSK